jgi:hypothetical protein
MILDVHSRFPDPDLDFLPIRIPDPGVKKAPDPGPGTATPINRRHKMSVRTFCEILKKMVQTSTVLVSKAHDQKILRQLLLRATGKVGKIRVKLYVITESGYRLS